MQIQATMRYHLVPIRMLYTKNAEATSTRSVWRTPSNMVDGNLMGMLSGFTSLENGMNASHNIKNRSII